MIYYLILMIDQSFLCMVHITLCLTKSEMIILDNFENKCLFQTTT